MTGFTTLSCAMGLALNSAIAAPVKLFTLPPSAANTGGAGGAVSADGRFLLGLGNDRLRPITVILNWAEDMKDPPGSGRR